MLVEQRTYTLRAGTVPEYMQLYEKEGLQVQRAHLPHLVGYYWSEIGELNQVIHMWAYTDLKQRDECRAALFGDERWRSVVQKLYTFIDRMENKILVPAPFSAGLLEGTK
ncbi:NIPSNAP protein [Paraburkholderia steynii]|uniref:NIPSNAP protein n=1 Tax=Paraburkholderia steynii TaxID=1245441 RepID=A0A7Z7FKM8_9BURK|nr:NIPSNAP family protein [Paraburkholderia steynii]SDI49672.1 NIPSNAP protein [Paraburkholderia steynii]